MNIHKIFIFNLKMVITYPPGYKLYTHLFNNAMRKLNTKVTKVIKFGLLRRFIIDFKNNKKYYELYWEGVLEGYNKDYGHILRIICKYISPNHSYKFNKMYSHPKLKPLDIAFNNNSSHANIETYFKRIRKNKGNCPKNSIILDFRPVRIVNQYNRSTECEKKAIKQTKSLYNYIIHNLHGFLKPGRASVDWYNTPIPIDYFEEYLLEFGKYKDDGACCVLLMNAFAAQSRYIPLYKYEYYYSSSKFSAIKGIITLFFRQFRPGKASLEFIYKYIECNCDGPLKDIKNIVLKGIQHENILSPPTKAIRNPSLRKIQFLDNISIDIIEKYINTLQKYFIDFWGKIAKCKSITPEFSNKYSHKLREYIQ